MQWNNISFPDHCHIVSSRALPPHSNVLPAKELENKANIMVLG